MAAFTSVSVYIINGVLLFNFMFMCFMVFVFCFINNFFMCVFLVKVIF